jgi:tetratricopeptide (TPR) repeat protein
LASNLHQEFRARVQLASNAFLAGDGAQAETYARESLDIAQTDQMQILAATGIIYLGNSYLRRRDFITAEKYYRDALALARRSGSSRLAASSLASLAGLHDQLDRSDEVAQEAQAALDYYQANRFASESSQCLTLLGRVRRKQSDYAGALTYFQRALEEAEKSKDRPQIAVAHESIGGVYLAREQYPRALEEFRKYLDLSTDAQHVGYANLRYGEMLWRLGRYAEATAALDKADGNATKYPSLRLSILKARAGLLLSQARSREAVELAQSAIALSGRDQSSDAFLNSLLGVAYIESGNRREGIRKCELALAAAVNSTDIVAVLQSRVMLARARLEAGDTNRAKDLLLQAEPLLTTYPESHWRTLALLAKVDPHYLGIAREALAELKRQWGDGAYGEYINRPDVRQLSWHVLQLNTANHQ